MSAFSAEQDESYRLMYYRYAAQESVQKPVRKLSGAKASQKASPKASPKVAPQKPAKKASDDFDLFGSDDEEQVKKEVKPVVTAKPAKAKPIAKSIIMFDVKVYEQEQDLKALAERIFDIKIDGLVWNKEPKILPVAYGMNKLQVGCVVEDDKVLTDDIFSVIESWEDDVQSCDIVSFQKL